MVLLLIIWILHPIINKTDVENNNKNFPFLY